jgi:membrane associated rhomboid family serine protease
VGWELWVVLAAAALGLQLITLVMRRQWREQRPFVALMAVDAALLSYAHATQRDGTLLGQVATSLALVMLAGPLLLDRLERRALARDDLAAALRAAKLRELLAPGRAATRRRRQLHNLAETRAGGLAAVLARLAAEIAAEKDAGAAALLHEEAATVLFLAQRFADGVAEAERHLPADWAAAHPPFAVYLVRAYGELGRLGRAADVLRVLEGGAAARDPGALDLLTHARLTFLAFAGRAGDVDRLLATEAGLLIAPRVRELLHVVAHERTAGELRNGDSEISTAALARLCDDVAARAAEGVRPWARPRRRAHVTVALIMVNVAATIVATHLAFTPPMSELVRAGALFRPAVQAGEWWRAFSAIFLHADPGHLTVNMIGLLLVGRFCEDVFGPLRFFIIYVGGGLAGAVGSTFVIQEPGLSVGASGAIMGLLAAAIVVLVLRRGIWPEEWRRTLLWYLVLIGVVQIYIDFQLPIIDNAAHIGGMLGGAAMTLLVAPGGLIGRSTWARAILLTIAAVALGAFVWAAVKVARTSLVDTFARLPTKTVNVGGQELRVPLYWEYDAEHDTVSDPYLMVQLPSQAPPNDAELRRVVERIAKSARAPQ